MNTTLADFQSDFPRIQKFVEGGQSVFIKGDNKTYEFRVSQDPAHDPLAEWRKTKGALLGCMKGTFDLSNEPEPEDLAIPIEDWGLLI